MNAGLRTLVNKSIEENPPARLTEVLRLLAIPTSSWYRQRLSNDERKRPGPTTKPISEEISNTVLKMAKDNPRYGYKRIAVMCRRAGAAVKDRQAYLVMKLNGLLQKRRSAAVEAHQAAKLFDLLPQGPNELWQMDVTYVHIPGHGWHYVVTVIDYYSRYLLACYLTTSYCASEVTHGLSLAQAEAERIRGPLKKPPFLVDRQWLVVHCTALWSVPQGPLLARTDSLPDAYTARVA